MPERNVDIFQALVILTSFTALPVLANGKIGEHVNHLSANIKKYEDEVSCLSSKIGGIVGTYQKSGAKAAHAEALMEHWEVVDFHAAIESNYVLIYASIWQGLYGVKDSIDQEAAVVVFATVAFPIRTSSPVMLTVLHCHSRSLALSFPQFLERESSYFKA